MEREGEVREGRSDESYTNRGTHCKLVDEVNMWGISGWIDE